MVSTCRQPDPYMQVDKIGKFVNRIIWNCGKILLWKILLHSLPIIWQIFVTNFKKTGFVNLHILASEYRKSQSHYIIMLTSSYCKQHYRLMYSSSCKTAEILIVKF